MLDDAEIPRVVTSSWRCLVTTRWPSGLAQLDVELLRSERTIKGDLTCESGKAPTITLAIKRPDDADALVDLFSDEVHSLKDRAVKLKLEPHGFRWLRVRRAGRRLPP